MKVIRILPIFVGGDKWTVDDLYDYIPIDKKRYRFVLDEKDPEYLFVAISHIIHRKNLCVRFRDYYSSKRIVIFFADEAISPDMNIFDYAITYDDSMNYDDRICHRPWNKSVAGSSMLEHLVRMSYKEAASAYDERRFCNFIYSNPNSFHVRDDLFYILNDYKRVDSLGNHLNNMNNKPDRGDKQWFESSVEAKKSYRFSICSENGKMGGYTSEKIVSSFLANSIPIYWGNNRIINEFNPEAFIDCNQCKDMNQVVEMVRNIEENKDNWIRMVTAPIQTDHQRRFFRNKNKEYVSFLNHIFDQSIEDGKRCPTTTASRNYVERMLGIMMQ